MANGHRPWTPAETARILKMWKAGRTDAEIGAKLGRSDASIARQRVILRAVGPHGGGSLSKSSPSSTPLPPRGYSAAQLAWALENNGEHPEAGLMLLYDRERTRFHSAGRAAP